MSDLRHRASIDSSRGRVCIGAYILVYPTARLEDLTHASFETLFKQVKDASASLVSRSTSALDCES